MKIFLLHLDGGLLLNSPSYPLTIIKAFEYSPGVKNPYHELHKDLFIRKTYDVETLLYGFFDMEAFSLPRWIQEKIKGEKHRRVARKFISYYKRNEDEFFRDVDSSWKKNEIMSYAFVSDIHKLMAIIHNCSNKVDNADKEFDVDDYKKMI
uniref:Uncharacterized protein n=1 Tax=Marseillevirus LCMAC101 TaxID=2506602 RepID=A0A481YQJ0_9VIRU|nr:MAG: hypothetical protein LCMAC101_00390 [Marseillevirus LCMAC101]